MQISLAVLRAIYRTPRNNLKYNSYIIYNINIMDCSNKMRKICQYTNLVRMSYLILINFLTFAITYMAFPDEVDCIKPASSLGMFGAVVSCHLIALFVGSVICTPRNVLPRIKYAYFGTTFLNLLAQFGVVIATFLYLIRDKTSLCETTSLDLPAISIMAGVSLYFAAFLNIIIIIMQLISNSYNEE